jgi:hypothetical protein
MNQDASVYELPGYIQSRLKPRIEIVAPPWETQEQILRAEVPAGGRGAARRCVQAPEITCEAGTARQHAGHAVAGAVRAEAEAHWRERSAERASEQVLEKTRE